MINKLIGVVRGVSGRLRRRLDPIGYAREIGVKIGKECRFCGKVEFGSEPYLVSLGNHVSITSSQFITHDGGVWVFRTKEPEIDVFAPIRVGNNVFIGYGSVILPGVTIGNNVVVGAGAIVTKDLVADSVYAGSPARKVKDLASYHEGIQEKILKTKTLSDSEKKKVLMNRFPI